MHEARLVQDLVREVDSVARRNASDCVDVVRIEIGARSHVTVETLTGQFEVFSQGSAAEGALLDISQATDQTADDAHDVRIVSIVVKDG
jgi:hydrogenase nickel incorporation protein HypA/HybF